MWEKEVEGNYIFLIVPSTCGKSIIQKLSRQKSNMLYLTVCGIKIHPEKRCLCGWVWDKATIDELSSSNPCDNCRLRSSLEIANAKLANL